MKTTIFLGIRILLKQPVYLGPVLFMHQLSEEYSDE